VNSRRVTNGISAPVIPSPTTPDDRIVLDAKAFQRMLALERKRSERSRKPFLLTLVDPGHPIPSTNNRKSMDTIVAALSLATRVTDVIGWYKEDSVIGILFTEIVLEDRSSVMSTMMSRISTVLGTLTSAQLNRVSISFHVFPEEWEFDSRHRPSDPTLYPDLSKRDAARRSFRIVKRGIDMVGSALALTFFSPVFLIIAIAIKLGSPGPVLYRQRRIGQHGVEFTFLKFRSMYVNNDATLHKEWFKRFRTGQEERHRTNDKGGGSYKLPNDPRVTIIGRFLRRTSLDELPQFINVLRGEMSLVGPRPPIGYEVEAYEAWHRRRVLEAKPGITGLWQVKGRSQVTFDEMVRLDLEYARTCSLWLDFQILLHTPHAVLMGSGAY
jgi:lipopolysaccharide/colanic/teichoic acid biosynthesis glycosyltransferase